jgi:TrmH family RNA methyltransferase
MFNEKTITSCTNQKIKLLKKLSQKKYRQYYNNFISENHTIIHDALKSGYDFSALFVTEEFKKKQNDIYKFLQENSKSKNFFIIDKKINKHYSQLSTPSGISAIYEINNLALQPKKTIIYLNAINDPGNLGTIIRTMIAFGFDNLVLDEECADIYNAKTIGAAKDAIFKINILQNQNQDYLKKIQNKIPIYVSNVKRGKNINDFKPANEFCLVLGSESHGVTQEIINLAQENIKIDISKNIESLNVAMATAIFLYKFKK